MDMKLTPPLLRSEGTKNNAKLESIAMNDFQKRSSRSTVL